MDIDQAIKDFELYSVTGVELNQDRSQELLKLFQEVRLAIWDGYIGTCCIQNSDVVSRVSQSAEKLLPSHPWRP